MQPEDDPHLKLHAEIEDEIRSILTGTFDNSANNKFNPDSTNAGINVGSLSGDPATPTSASAMVCMVSSKSGIFFHSRCIIYQHDPAAQRERRRTRVYASAASFSMPAFCAARSS